MRNNNATLAIRLFSVINTEASASVEYQIAKYVLEHIQDMDISSTSSLAAQCNVSKASVSRFCQQIGLNDFFELRAEIFNFKKELVRKMNFDFSGTPAEMRRSFLNDTIVKLTILRDCLEDGKIDELVRDLKSGRPVTAMGHMQSGNTALNMQHNLFVADKIIMALTKSTAQVEYFHKATADDVAVIFSVSGDFMENLFYGAPHFAPHAKPKIYLFTANTNLGKKPYADVIYNCRSGYELSGGNASLDVMQQLITLSYSQDFKGTVL